MYVHDTFKFKTNWYLNAYYENKIWLKFAIELGSIDLFVGKAYI